MKRGGTGGRMGPGRVAAAAPAAAPVTPQAQAAANPNATNEGIVLAQRETAVRDANAASARAAANPTPMTHREAEDRHSAAMRQFEPGSAERRTHNEAAARHARERMRLVEASRGPQGSLVDQLRAIARRGGMGGRR